jgi:hypothetical protein
VVLDKGTKEHLIKMSNGTNDRCFTCGKSGHFAKDCRLQNTTSVKESMLCCIYCDIEHDSAAALIKHENNCKQSKNVSYFQRDINKQHNKYAAKTQTYNSDGIEDCYVYEKNTKSKNKKCFRCARDGHYSSSCYASTHTKGYYLND